MPDFPASNEAHIGRQPHTKYPQKHRPFGPPGTDVCRRINVAGKKYIEEEKWEILFCDLWECVEEPRRFAVNACPPVHHLLNVTHKNVLQAIFQLVFMSVCAFV